jgi:LysM repeat protein
VTDFMRKQKRICFRLTARRIVGAVLLAASAANLTIVGVALDISSSGATPAATVTLPTLTSTVGETIVSIVTSTDTFTLVPSATPTYTFTATSTVTQTASLTPTYTITSTSTHTFTPSTVPCVPRYSWPSYLIQKGDTLFSLARAIDSTVYDLMLANCLLDDVIYVDKFLYVPRLPIATLTATPTKDFATCAEFEDLNSGSVYKAGERFITSNTIITVGQYVWGNGTPTADGYAAVAAQRAAGGFGNEMQVNNVNLNFMFDVPSNNVSLLFGEYGGNLNMNINGEFLNFADFADVNGRVIGGVNVSVLNGLGNDKGFLQLSGAVKTFALGGQELWIDNVCPQVNGR